MSDPVDLKSWEPDYTADPYPLIGRLRDSGPAARAGVDGLTVWLVTGYDEIRQALLDPALRNDPVHAGPDAVAIPWTGASQAAPLMRHMLRSDPPDHARLRRLVSKAFSARRVAGLRPRIKQITQASSRVSPAKNTLTCLDVTPRRFRSP